MFNLDRFDALREMMKGHKVLCVHGFVYEIEEKIVKINMFDGYDYKSIYDFMMLKTFKFKRFSKG